MVAFKKEGRDVAVRCTALIWEQHKGKRIPSLLHYQKKPGNEDMLGSVKLNRSTKHGELFHLQTELEPKSETFSLNCWD